MTFLLFNHCCRRVLKANKFLLERTQNGSDIETILPHHNSSLLVEPTCKKKRRAQYKKVSLEIINALLNNKAVIEIHKL